MADVNITSDRKTVSLTANGSSSVEQIVSNVSTKANIQSNLSTGGKGDKGDSATDGHYEQSFTSTSFLTVTHNLGKHPSVTIVDSAGDEVEGQVNNTSSTSLTLTFSAPFSGVVYLN